MKISITFDPSEDGEEDVAAMVSRVYGNAGEAEEAEEAAPAAKKSTKKKAAAKEPEPEPEPEAEVEEEGPTQDEVREALKAYAAIEGKPAAIKILKDNGADSISELDAENYAAVIEACSA